MAKKLSCQKTSIDLSLGWVFLVSVWGEGANAFTFSMWLDSRSWQEFHQRLESRRSSCLGSRNFLQAFVDGLRWFHCHGNAPSGGSPLVNQPKWHVVTSGDMWWWADRWASLWVWRDWRKRLGELKTLHSGQYRHFVREGEMLFCALHDLLYLIVWHICLKSCIIFCILSL